MVRPARRSSVSTGAVAATLTCARCRVHGVEQFLQDLARGFESIGADDARRRRLDVGHPSPASRMRRCPRSVRTMSFARRSRVSALRARYPRTDEFVHQLRRGRQAELRAAGEVGQPDVPGTEIAEDLQVRVSNVDVATIRARSPQLPAELTEQPDEQLADRLAACRRIVTTPRHETILREAKLRVPKYLEVAMSAKVATPLGGLYVTDLGAGPGAMFWHSLFVDQASWRLVIDALGAGRRVLLVDAPNHGRSDAVDRDFSIDDCAVAAGAVLDHLGITEPVDWVGNALGGHIGITLAAQQPDRVRTLVTIGTPVEGFGALEKWTRILPLVQIYRAFGPAAVDRLLTTALLGPEAVAAQPDQAWTTMEAFRRADRHAMLRAMRCLMVHRRSLRHEIERITCPTLLLVAEGGRRDGRRASRLPSQAVWTMRWRRRCRGPASLRFSLAPELIAERLQRFWRQRRDRSGIAAGIGECGPVYASRAAVSCVVGATRR